MYIITNKEDNRIFKIAKEVDYLNNGYPRVVELNIAFPNDMVNVYEVETVPEYVEEEKYCYDGNEFTVNENYQEPIREISNEEIQKQITDLQLALCEIYEGVISNG